MSSSTCRNLIFIVCFVGTSVAYGQRFSYGVKGGVSTIEPDTYNDESKRYIVGATVEYRLWRGFAVEGDFLYRRNGVRFDASFTPAIPSNGDSALVSITQRLRLDVFELPVLGKYYFRRDSKVQPFVLTGYSFRKALANGDARTTTQNTAGTSTQNSHASNWTPLDIGASFGTGLKWRVGPVSFSPEIRYTRWGSHPSAGFSKNQADVLLGITF